jgi:hypothetical protein
MKPPLQTRCFKEALARVQHLFVDTPGVQLTPADAAHMAGLDRQVCRMVLRTLTESGVLEQRMERRVHPPRVGFRARGGLKW